MKLLSIRFSVYNHFVVPAENRWKATLDSPAGDLLMFTQNLFYPMRKRS